MLEVWVSIRIRMLLLEGDIAVELGEVLSKRTEVFFKILCQLLASNLMRATINDQSSQIFPSFLLVEVCLHFVVHRATAISRTTFGRLALYETPLIFSDTVDSHGLIFIVYCSSICWIVNEFVVRSVAVLSHDLLS